MAALEMTADQAGVELADDDKQAVTAQLRQLPAHPEVLGALRRLASLTNLTKQVARASWRSTVPGSSAPAWPRSPMPSSPPRGG
jgi:hypothetical protein